MGSKITTDVTFNGRNINIKQHKGYIVSFGHQNIDINVDEINDVILKKSISWESMAFVGMGFFMFILDLRRFIGLLLMIIPLLFFKDKWLYIYWRNGYVRIPKVFASQGDMDQLIEHIKYYNPDSVKITINN